MTNDNTKPLPPLTAAEIAELRRQYEEYHNSGYEEWGNARWCQHIEDKFDRLLAAAEREQKLRELLSQARDDSVDCLNEMLERKLDTYRPKSVESQRQFIADIDAALAETEEK